jgi:hypothetical protein
VKKKILILLLIFFLLSCFPLFSFAGTGKLRITSEPEGATVFLNSYREGQTPITVDLAVGPYTVRIEKKDYTPVTQEVVVSDGEVTELNIKLEKSD